VDSANLGRRYTAILEKNFPAEMRKSLKVFHLRGGIHMDTYGDKVDFADRKTVAPLVEHVRGLLGGNEYPLVDLHEDRELGDGS
jgi:hypothetical protein